MKLKKNYNWRINIKYELCFLILFVLYHIGYQHLGLNYHHIFLSVCRSVLTHSQRSGTGYLLVILCRASVLLGLVQHCLSADSQCSAARNEPKEFCWNYWGWWSASIWESYFSGENFLLCKYTSLTFFYSTTCCYSQEEPLPLLSLC